MYILRDTNGVMRAMFSNQAAQDLINGSTGFFRAATFKSGKVTAWQFQQSYKFTFGCIEVMVWEDEILVPEKD